MKQSKGIWDLPRITALGRQSQKDPEFEIILGYTARPCLKKTKTKQ
jgi:hypothetical protein